MSKVKVKMYVKTTEEISIPDIAIENGELTDAAYRKYMGETSALLNGRQGVVYCIETLDGNMLAEY